MSEPAPRPLLRALRWVHRVEDAAVVALLGAMVVLAGAQILLRNLLGGGVGWIDPLLRALVLWVGLAGAVVASRADKHIAIDALVRLLPLAARCPARAAACTFTAAVAGVIAFHSGRLVAMEYGAGIEAFAGVPSWALQLALPAAFGVIAVRYLLRAGLHLHTALRRPRARAC